MKNAVGRYVGLALVCSMPLTAGCSGLTGNRWYKGSTHTHTWWSDGNSPPEIMVKQYVDLGFHFVVLGDHNIINAGEKWVAQANTHAGVKKYEQQFPATTIHKRQVGDKTEYRLKTIDELKADFERPGEFILIQGEEISDVFDKRPVHLSVVNIAQVIPPQKGRSVAETLQRNIDAVLAQRQATGQPMLVHVNHPNFKFGLMAEDMVGLTGARFFEVYNGCGVDNEGMTTRISTEKIWDVVLSRRLGELNLPVMYGVATDDAHNYTVKGGAGPGRGWVMVRAKRLTPDALIAAMEKGDFYASTGVALRQITFKNNTLTVEIEPKPGVTYLTQFIGTPRNYCKKTSTRPADNGYTIYEYSQDIGKVFAETIGDKADYQLTGDELYVRAKVISSEQHPNPPTKGEMQAAWTQPVTAK